MDFTIQAACVATALVAAATDVYDQRVPNWLIFPAAILAVGLHSSVSGFAGLFFSLEGLTVGFALLIGFYAVGGMGAGDVKLLAAIGAFVGPREVFQVFLFAAVFGGIYALAVIMYLWAAESRRAGGLALAIRTVLLTGFHGQLKSWGHYPKLRYAVVLALGVLVSQAR